jgi:pSer/pThr/pTyr-binding forkhead associated (FHA) protein
LGDRLGKTPLKLLKTVVVVGCDEHCHLHLKSSTISRHHALLIQEKHGVYVRDLGSRTKVVVNGQPEREKPLEDGDEIHFGRFSFKFTSASSNGVSENGVVAAQIIFNGKPLPNLFNSRTLLIGRGEECDVSVGSEYVSSRHAVIFSADGKRYIRDLDSRTGTFVNNKEVHQQEIKFGDEIKIGPAKIKLATLQASAAPAIESERAAAPVEPLPVGESVEATEANPVEEAEVPEPVTQATASAMPAEPEIDLAAKIPGPSVTPTLPLATVGVTAAASVLPTGIGASSEAPATDAEPIDLSMEPLTFETETESAEATQSAEPVSVETEQAITSEPRVDRPTDETPLKLEPAPEVVAESSVEIPAHAPEAEPAATQTAARETPVADMPLAETSDAPDPFVAIDEPPIKPSDELLSLDVESDIAKEIDIAPLPIPAPSLATIPAAEPEPVDELAGAIGPVETESAAPSVREPTIPEANTVEPGPAPIEEANDLPELAISAEPDVALNILEPTLAQLEQPSERLPGQTEPPSTEQSVAVDESGEQPEIAAAAEPALQIAPEAETVPEPVSPKLPIVVAQHIEEPEPIDLAEESIDDTVAPEPPLRATGDMPTEPSVDLPASHEPAVSSRVADAELSEPAIDPILVEDAAPRVGVAAASVGLTDVPSIPEPELETTASIAEPQDHAVIPAAVELPTSEPDIFTPPTPDMPVGEPSAPPLSLDLSDVPELSIGDVPLDRAIQAEAVEQLGRFEPSAVTATSLPTTPKTPSEPETSIAEATAVEAATVDSPTGESSIVATAIPEAPLVETQALESPAIETAPVETPSIDASTIEAPAVETPTAEIPAPGIPTLEIPIAAAPVAGVPIPEVPKRRVRRPRAAPPPTPKPKKSSRARVNRKPPAAETEQAPEAPAVAEPVLDQLAIDVPPVVKEEMGATIPAEAVDEEAPIAPRVAAPEIPSVVETPIAPIEITAPVDAAPPMESSPVEAAPPIEIAPLQETPPPHEIAAPSDLATPVEAPMIDGFALSHDGEERTTVPAQMDWQAPPAADEELLPPYVPEEPVTTVSIAPAPELHTSDPESIAPAPELVATSPELAEPASEPYVPALEPTTTTIDPTATAIESSAALIELRAGEPSVPPSMPSADARSAAPPEAPMSSLGGMGTVNLDHFLGGMPAATDFGAPPLIESSNFMIGGGIPVELPPLPQTPEWFGKFNYDFKSKPRPAPPVRPPPSKAIKAPELIDDEPILEGRLSIDDRSPAAEALARSEPLSEAAPSPMPEAPAESPETAKAPGAPEVSPPQPAVAPAIPKPAAPPPKITAAPPAKPKIKPPPPSFTPRPRRGPFSTEAQELGEADLPADHAMPGGASSGSMPFDGLAMPAVREADVFSNFDSSALHVNDAAFGGARMGRPGDFHIPETPEVAGRRSDDPDYDFAEDDFWNRTDEEDEQIANATEPTAAGGSAPVKPPAFPTAEAAKPTSRPVETPATVAPPTEPFETDAPVAEPHAETPEAEPEPGSAPGPKVERPADPLSAEIDNPSEPPSADIPQEPVPAEDMRNGEGQNVAIAEPSAPGDAPPPRKRRRFRIPFLLPLLIVGMLGGMAAVYFLTPITCDVVGTLSFLNFSWTPGTQDSIEMEASQRRYLQDVVRPLAMDNLKQVFPGTSAGFLDVQDLYSKVTSSVDFSGTDQTTPPRTYLTLRYRGLDKEGDRLRMLALLQGLAQANAPLLEGNHRLRDAAQKAQRLVDDNQKKVDDIKNDLTQVQAIIDAQPSLEDLTHLASQKADLEHAKLDAEQALSRDQASLDKLQKWAPAIAAATTQPEINDPQLSQMNQQLADLSAEADSARSDQVTAAVLARQNLENAAKQFNDQIASANEALGTGSQLRQFVDSAMDTQSKARDLINMLIVDGEDLEEQLEDTRRQMDDLIEARQAEIWASDDQLHQLRDKLQSAQHRYNANVGQGVNDPRVLDPIQKEIDDTSTQMKARQAELGVDPSEIKVQESINHVIVSLRNKLAKEKQQIDAALDPLEKQLTQLDPTVSALPQAQQDLARLIRERLDDLNTAREKYAKTVGDEGIAPSAKVADLQTRIAELKSRIAARKADLVTAQAASRDTQHQKNLVAAQAKVDADQKSLDTAAKELETGAAAYEDAHARHETAITAQQKKISLLDDQRAAFTDLQRARRDRDEKQSAADHAFDIAPVTDEDVRVTNPQQDPRIMYMLIIACAGAIGITALAFLSHSSRAKEHESGELESAQHDELDLNLHTPPEGLLR